MVAMKDFAKCYDNHFTVVRANTPSLLDRVYRLRYQVYCKENSYFPEEHFDGRETDEHDAVSAHILLLHKQSGSAIGTARLIMPQLGYGWRPLPVWQVMTPRGREQFERLASHRTAEISRFAVSKEFRRWWRDHHGPAASETRQQVASGEQQLMLYVTFGLIQEILLLSLERGIDYLTAVMNPSLIRILTKLGLEFEPIGGIVDYHGIRQPCIALLRDLVVQSKNEFTPLWQFVSHRDAYRLSRSGDGERLSADQKIRAILAGDSRTQLLS